MLSHFLGGQFWAPAFCTGFPGNHGIHELWRSLLYVQYGFLILPASTVYQMWPDRNVYFPVYILIQIY